MKYLKYFLFSILLIIVHSCKDSSNSVLPIIANYQYPLQIGNKWNYRDSTSYINVRPDSIRYLLDNLVNSSEVSVIKDTILNSIVVRENYEKTIGTIGVYEAHGYYVNTPEGLLKYAYSGYNLMGLPKVNQQIQYLFKGRRFNSINEIIQSAETSNFLMKTVSDSINYFQPPRVIYKYPINQNMEWLFGVDGLLLNKQYEGKTNVETSFGILECVAIKWKYDIDKDGKWDEDFFVYEYLSTKGKVKMTYTIKDIVITTSEYPDGIGKVDLNYEQMITSINF